MPQISCLLSIGIVLLACAAFAAGAPARADRAAAVLDDDLPGVDPKLTTEVVRRLKARGLRTVCLTADQVADPKVLTPKRFHTLVLPCAPVYPAGGAQALERFLASGGDLIAMQTPAFTQAVTKLRGRWIGRGQWLDLLRGTKPQKVLWDFEETPAEPVGYLSHRGAPATREVARGGADGTARALHCVVPNFQGWNTFVLPARKQPFAAGQTLTCLWAKGARETRSLALEWAEADGSRWIATIRLTPRWRHYVLRPQDFHYWHDSPARGRGGPGDRLRPANAAKFTVAVAQSHTPLPPGRHEFWVDRIGVAANELADVDPPGGLAVQPIEMVCPAYKFHDVTVAKAMRVSDKQCLLAPAELAVPAGLRSVHPRPQATGCDKGRDQRWIPLIEAFDAKGEVCGTPACLVIRRGRAGRPRGAAAVSFALPAPAWKDPRLLDLVAAVAARLRGAPVLWEGGSDRFAYFEDQKMVLGARAVALGEAGPAVDDCRVRFTVASSAGAVSRKELALKDGRARVQPPLKRLDRDDYEVTVELLSPAGELLDRLRHPVIVSRPPKRPQYMQIRDGHFVVGGRRWIAHGVNYMPSSGIGTEDGDYFERWMGRRPYDPVVIQRDLVRAKALGLNMVSIFVYHQSLDSGNLTDILERCRRLGLRVNLSLRPGCPLRGFYPDKMKEIVEAARLARDDNLFAYDLSWEPTWRDHADRTRWDGAWHAWVVERYGSVAAAEADWGAPIPRAGGKVTGPSDEQMRTEGPHRVMLCAYRRFLDDLLARKWADARSLIRSADPHHFVSFRMSVAGDPTHPAHAPGYDFRGLAHSVDFMQPEGYGRIGDWDRVRHGRFTVDYARCMAPGKPVLWAEFGCHSWDRQAMHPDPAREKWVGQYYRWFYRMAREADADGTVCWWYPGGYRVNERSDYGIVNPDGSPRPNSRAVRDLAAGMTTPPPPGKPDAWIEIDRDATARGLTGVYEAVRRRYWRLIDEGKAPALRAQGDGLDSATAPRLAVGNTPYKPGRNPHKFLNAQFDRVEVRGADGRWRPVTDGQTVRVGAGRTLTVRAAIGNLGPTKWLSREGKGQVRLTCGRASVAIPENAPAFGTVTVPAFDVPIDRPRATLTLQMLAVPDVSFGQKLRLRLPAK